MFIEENKEALGSRKAILQITEAVHEGRSMSEIQHSINVGVISNPTTNTSEQALITLANEICGLKDLGETNVVEETSRMQGKVDLGVAALVRAVEKTAIECDEVSSLISESNSFKQPTSREEIGTVSPIIEQHGGVVIEEHENDILINDVQDVSEYNQKETTKRIQPLEIISESNVSEAIENAYLVQSPTETPTFEEVIIKVTDAVNEGKDVNEIQTGFCIEEINVIEEESSQVQLGSLINQICESRGTEQIIDEEFLKPQNEVDHPDLLKCFVSVLEKFSIEPNEMIIFLKESVLLEGESIKIKATKKHSDSMTPYNVTSNQPCSTTTPSESAPEEIKILSENVSSLDNITMVGYELTYFDNNQTNLLSQCHIFMIL